MSIFRNFPFLFVMLLGLVMPLTSIQCTSSDDDSTVLEDELDDLGSVDEDSIEDLDDLSDISDADLEDVVVGESGIGDTDDFAENELAEDLEGSGFDDFSGEEGEFAGLDDEFSDEDFGGDEFAEGSDEFAEFDDEEFAEFDDIEDLDVKGKDELAQNEAALAQEINGQPGMNDYPVAENAQPQFPEEIMGGPQGLGGPPPGQDSMAMGQSPIPPPGQPLITSETQDFEVADASNEPEVPQEDLGIADPILPDDDFESDSTSTQNWIPVVKIKTDPFFRNERLINAVYIARPGDDLASVSNKVYQDDRTKELLEDNPHLTKGIDPGDKIYYNSPNRPDDRSALKVYYSDIGLPPQFYKTEQDDNMRRLGSKLLGFADGWKEIWAINAQVDSKTILPAGLELKYWTGNEQKPGMELTSLESEKIGETGAMNPEEDLSAGVGEINDPFADDNLPPEPPLPEAQIAMPEPEPVPDIEPFPEEGLQETPGGAPVARIQEAQDNSLLTVGALALLVLAGVGLVAIQIKRRKDSTGINPQSLEYTQV